MAIRADPCGYRVIDANGLALAQEQGQEPSRPQAAQERGSDDRRPSRGRQTVFLERDPNVSAVETMKD